MANRLETSAKKTTLKAKNNMYTGLLGLAILALAATIAMVCMYSLDMYGTIFTFTSAP